MNAARRALIPRNPGRRRSDQFDARIKRILKVTTVTLAALFLFYKASIILWVEAVLTWREQTARLQSYVQPPRR